MTAASSSSSESPSRADADGAHNADAERRPAPGAAIDAERRPIQQPAGQPLIELRNLGIWYRLHQRGRFSLRRVLAERRKFREEGKFWALRGISLDMHAGEVLGVVGHNGAGKSTLCLALARILTPDEGTATVRGEITPLFSLGTGFHRELSGRENIAIYAAFLGIPRKRIRAMMDDIIAFSELGRFIDQPLHTYSTGMRGRLGFSVAAVLQPEILVLDEVLGAGDRSFRAKSRARILDMMRQSKVIVIVSHSSNYLRRVCTHCLWLDHGCQHMHGPAAEVLDAYDRAFGTEITDAGADGTDSDDDPE